jgi:3',5'-cyclic AMP phosphodiesterase CpdA
LHLSDLHRDLGDEIENSVLLESIARDFSHFDETQPPIAVPSIAIVSGDLVYGVPAKRADSANELARQYKQAEEFLIGLADRCFNGNRDHIILIPGNHDVSQQQFMASVQKLDTPADAKVVSAVLASLFHNKPKYRWNWKEFALYEIVDQAAYLRRFDAFREMYNRFYRGARTYSSAAEDQFHVFDFPELNFTCLALNSCFNNDTFRRCGSFHPRCLALASESARSAIYAGRTMAAVWHHNLAGGPQQDDYMDGGMLQILIDAGVSLGFHGHQHRSDFLDQRFLLDERNRHINVISAGTLCAAPSHIPTGEARSFNILEVDTVTHAGRLHQRRMSNSDFSNPVWTAGKFTVTQKSHIDFEICKPAAVRPRHLDASLILERAEETLRSGKPRDAINHLKAISNEPTARPLLVEALAQAGDDEMTVQMLGLPQTVPEAVLCGWALIRVGKQPQIEAFLRAELVTTSRDASINDVVERLQRKVRR